MSSMTLCVLLALVSVVSAKVTINGKDETVSIKYQYLGNGDNSITPTRTEKDIQDCLTNNGTALKTSVSCKKMQYNFANSAPCVNGATSTKDPGTPKAMACSAGQKTQTCYQSASSTFTNAFTTKPTFINWQCTGKDEFCCGYECCKPRSTKWIWIIVLLLLLFFVGIPCIALCVCCCFCGLFAKCMSMVCKKGSSPPPQTNQVQDYKIEPVDNYRFNHGQYNAPPRAMY
ncbi:hypothetical protein PRIPAC_71065 [Pristionchus pacificus]|nr:hypothetical protein PRIPAC_71065 [Pristionchus pacificus]